MGSQRPTQAVGCNFLCYRVIFDVDNAKSVVKLMQKKKEYKIFQKERLQTLITKIT